MNEPLWRVESAPWRTKCHELIYKLCRASFLQANQKENGLLYKVTRPYTVPQEAKDLINCLNTNDEVGAKTLFNYDYNISKIS